MKPGFSNCLRLCSSVVTSTARNCNDFGLRIRELELLPQPVHLSGPHAQLVKTKISNFFYGHHACERACCTISIKTFLVSAELLTSRKNAMRVPRMPVWVFKRI